MTAQIIAFPSKAKPEPSEDEQAIDCRNCIHARFGALTHCTLVGESIIDEIRTASECDAFEKEELL